MELNEEPSKLDNDLFNQDFKQQDPIDTSKIKDVLTALSKIAKDDTVAKAQLIDKSSAVRKILSKFDAS